MGSPNSINSKRAVFAARANPIAGLMRSSIGNYTPELWERMKIAVSEFLPMAYLYGPGETTQKFVSMWESLQKSVAGHEELVNWLSRLRNTDPDGVVDVTGYGYYSGDPDRVDREVFDAWTGEERPFPTWLEQEIRRAEESIENLYLDIT